ncbi:MAG: cadherin domain protein, partial [bacterium]|nr:cadherin domain protein [bacterium]
TVAVDDTTVGATPDDTAPLAISVTDVNEAPTVALTNTTTTLLEDATTTPRIKVADIVVTDDALGSETLSLSGDDAAMFEIDGTVLYLKAGETLDFETNPQLDVTVAVDDTTVGATPDDTAPLAISVTDVNEAPTVALTSTTTTLLEDATTTPRVKVADIVVTDDALGTETLSLSGDDAAMFEIDGTVLYLKAGETLDFETNPQLDVTVAVDDTTVGATPDDTAPLAISVTDVNEAPTVALTNTTTTLLEDATTTPRVKVADIVVTDDALGTETLSLSGDDAAMFEIDGTVLYLKAGETLDFETNPQLDVTVAVDDTTVGATPDDT